MVKFLRTNKIASIILAIIRIYLGISWTLAGWEKITGGASGAVKGLLSNAIKNPVKVLQEKLFILGSIAC